MTLAQRYAPQREDGLADVGLSYPLVRQMLRELGGRLVAAGAIEQADDIFWLTQSEVEQAVARLDRGEQADRLIDLIPPRKAAWRAALRVTPPMMLPHMPLIEKMKTARKRRGGKDSLKGVAASPGRVTATARVLSGPEDFDQMQAGDVLVASITTPAWTPLFARAAAVVTDVGGPLSHGSIVAREYGIPAVLGTGAATMRIHSGQLITVDGSTRHRDAFAERQSLTRATLHPSSIGPSFAVGRGAFAFTSIFFRFTQIPPANTPDGA